MAMLGRLRQSVQSNPIPIAIVAGIVVLAAFIWIIRARTARSVAPGVTGHWYYDIESKKLFVQSEMDLPIAVPPSGAMLTELAPGGLRAHVYSCGDCSDESKREILFVESYVPTKDAQTLGVPSDGTSNSVFIRAKFEPTLRWVRGDSLDGLAIKNLADTHCGGKPATECFPPAP